MITVWNIWISIHAPARGATVVHRTGYATDGISIHAPREGGDEQAMPRAMRDMGISIHAPREGGDGNYLLLSADL